MPTRNRAGGPAIARALARSGLLAICLGAAALAPGATRADAALPPLQSSDASSPSPAEDERASKLLGVVFQEGEAPNGESPVVVLEGWTATPEQRERGSQAPPWLMEEIARTEPDDQGLFEFDLPEDVDVFRIDVAGRYLYSDRPIFIPDRGDGAGDERLGLRVRVGAYVEVSYASDEGDVDVLRGRRIVFARGGHDAREATIDGDGIARLRGLPPGTWQHAITEVAKPSRNEWLERHHADALEPFAVDTFPLFVCDRGDDLAARVSLERAARMEATLVDAEGDAIADAWFEATGSRRTAIGWDSTDVTGRSDAAGRVRVPVPRSGIEAWEFSAFSEGRGVVRLGPAATARLVDPEAPVRIAIPPDTEAVRVEVVFPDDAPAAGVELEASTIDAGEPGPIAALRRDRARTDDGGRAELALAVAAASTLRASVREVRRADGSRARLATVPEDFGGEVLGGWSLEEEVSAERVGSGAPLRLRLREWPTVRGAVAPAAHADESRLHVESYEPRSSGVLEWVRVAEVDPATGAFEVPLAPGVRLLRVGGEGVTGELRAIDVPTDEVATLRWAPASGGGAPAANGDDGSAKDTVRLLRPDGSTALVERPAAAPPHSSPIRYRGRIAAGTTALTGCEIVLANDAGVAGRTRIGPTGEFAITTRATGPMVLEVLAPGPAVPPDDDWFVSGISTYTPPRPITLVRYAVTLDPARPGFGPATLGGGSIEARLDPRRLRALVEDATLVARRVADGTPIERHGRSRSMAPVLHAGSYEVFYRAQDGSRIDAIAPATVTLGKNEHVSCVLRLAESR